MVPVGISAVRLLLAAVALLGACDALAQRPMYRCSTDGRSTLSDKPCEGGRPSTTLSAVGPLQDPSTSRSTDTSTRRAVDYLDYLSPQCSELNEGLRNGPGRGLGARAMDELRRSYNELCRDEDQQARRRLQDEQSSRRDARAREADAERRQSEMKKLSVEQCDEMYRILHGKRPKVPTMSPGERADFQRFEANWQARCKSG